MRVKTNELTGPALDWAVAKCEDESVRVAGGSVRFALSQFTNDYDLYSPSTDRDQGWSIAEREKLCIGFRHQLDNMYVPTIDPDVICWARTTAGGHLKYGPTPLIAAMRCYVASELGDEVDVPEELV